uniref:ZP domain-containing protein n=1 Tax=Parastrongyloides trichosuri TaxID=131310 RepID=A0A0N4ZM15_PARTI
MIFKNLVFLIFLTIFSIEETNSRRLPRSRNIDIPYNIYGQTKCGYSGLPDVNVVLKDNSRFFFPSILSTNYSDYDGKFTLIAEVPYKSQKFLELYFYHRCNIVTKGRYTGRNLYIQHLGSGCYWRNRRMNCDVGSIQLAGRRNQNYPARNILMGPWGRK